MVAKRVLALLLALVTLGSLSSCVKDNTSMSDAPAPSFSSPATEDGTSLPQTSGKESPSSPTLSKEEEQEIITLLEEDMKLYQGSYDILYDRITDRGYAITSLTGTYVGMFTRDSSIQAMAHLSNGDSTAARAILRYLLSYHAVLGLQRGTHIVDEIKDEEYGNNYLSMAGASSDSAAQASYYIAQRKYEQGIYALNAPNNGGAQPFVPQNEYIYGVQVHLNKTGNNDKVNLSIRTDYDDPATAIGETSYTFGTNQNGWQSIYFEEPLSVTPGKTYYLVLQAPAGSGKVIWNGTTKPCGSINSYNYDVSAFGGWVEKPYYLAYEILSYPMGAPLAQSVTARGGSIDGVEINLFAAKADGKIKAEIREDYTDPATCIGTAEAEITHTGEKKYLLSFESALPVTKGKDYFLVLTLTDAQEGTRILADPATPAKSFAQDENNWLGVGYAFLASPLFDSDRAPLMTLDGNTAGVQEIPCDEEVITAVRLLLSAEQGAMGKIKATLYKGSGQDAQLIDSKTMDASALLETAEWVTFKFDLPLFKINKNDSYFIKVESEGLTGKVYWHGSGAIDRYESYTEQKGTKTALAGDLGFEALFSHIRLISDYTQTDATYMLIHAWAMYVNNNDGTPEDVQFIKDSYPIIKGFANYYLTTKYYNKKLNLILNPSLEHSKKGRYWIAYDLITNVFASQAFHELVSIAKEQQDEVSAEKWAAYAKNIEKGINKNLVTEVDGKKIYGEFYDVEDNMKFYQGMSWVNLAPVAAEWYATDPEIMKNTYEIYKKYASVTMYGHTALATEATLGTNELTRELIGKGLAWELMLCHSLGDTKQIQSIVELVLKTAKKNNISVYPEFWKSESYVTDPGNQEHCSWQVYAMSKVFSELSMKNQENTPS